MELDSAPKAHSNGQSGAGFTDGAMGLRVAEKLVLGFLAYALLVSIVFPLSSRVRLTVASLNLISSSTLVFLSREGPRTKFLTTLRDWLPCVLILLAYRESGLFYTPDLTHRLDHLFVRWDSVLLVNPWVQAVLSVGSPWVQHYLELSYLFCYPIIPLGLGSLHLGRRFGFLRCPNPEPVTDQFWTPVLLALLFCYLIYPLFPLTPPRLLFNDVPGPPVQPLFRKVNFWLLGQYGVGACIFPSGHVAGVTATALALRTCLPRVSALFLIAAASVAVATVYGRYHYAADAVAGALVGLSAALLSRRIHGR